MKFRALVSTFSTTLIIAALAAVWSVASPLGASSACALPLSSIVQAPNASTDFVTAINQLRTSKGLNALAVDGNLTNIATEWSVQMAQNDGISHRLNLADGITSLWRRLGENVGVGPTVGQLMDAFIASPGHYKNLVDPTFTHVGVGTVRTNDGLLYTSHEFASLESSGPAVTVPPTTQAPPVTAPRVTTPVTAPPTTVVTAPPTTEAPATTAVTSPAEDDELEHRSTDNQQQQDDESQNDCGAHTALKLQASSAWTN